MENSIFIDGIGISNYRSFNDIQYIGPCQKINIIIGKNNSGKSNILRYLNTNYETVIKNLKGHDDTFSFSGRDIPKEHTHPETRLSFGLSLNGQNHLQLLKRHLKENESDYSELITKILSHLKKDNDSNIIWFDYVTDKGRTTIYEGTQKSKIMLSRLCHILHEKLDNSSFNPEKGGLVKAEWQCLWSRISGSNGGDLQQWVSATLNALSPINHITRPIHFIPAIRFIRKVDGPPDTNKQLHDGSNVTAMLLRLQSPNIDNQHNKKGFRAINDFAKSVLNNESVQLDIPHDESAIHVEIDGKLLPLEELGTGITEVIILAAAATAIKKSIVCLEEPELHLHPILQRKLIEYLKDHTDNQYFITTHSAHILNTEDAAIFHVKLEEGVSKVTGAIDANHKFSICSDLGYHASDLLQANSIIWVEGPSDRIYVNYWINSIAPKLVEGLHYSIMFYGGKLLSHLTAEDEINDFISLKKLNRNMSILIDCDKKNKNTAISATKKRILQEFNKEKGIGWLTEGKEIENYIPTAIIQQAIEKVHKKFKGTVTNDKYGNVFDGIDNPSKIKVAQEAVSLLPDLNTLDLRNQVDSLVNFIRNAND